MNIDNVFPTFDGNISLNMFDGADVIFYHSSILLQNFTVIHNRL